MAQKTARMGELGVGIETGGSEGTAVDPTRAIPYTSPVGLQDKQEKVIEDSARGRRENPVQAVTVKKWAEGSVETDLDVENSIYFLAMMLGTVSSATDADGTGNAYNHTITVKSSITPKTATLVYDRGQDKRQFTYAVVESIDISVEEGLAKLTASIKSKASAASTKTIPADEVETLMAFKDYSAKFGADVSAAQSASATSLVSLNLHIEADVYLQFRSGSDEPSAIVVGGIRINGDYTVDFGSDTERDKFLNDTVNALIVDFLGETIDTGSQEEIKITLPRIRIKEEEISAGGLDEPYTVTQTFDAEFDTSEAYMAQIIVTNLQDGSDY